MMYKCHCEDGENILSTVHVFIHYFGIYNFYDARMIC